MAEQDFFKCPRCGAENPTQAKPGETQPCANAKCLAVVVLLEDELGYLKAKDTKDTYLSQQEETTVRGMQWSKIGNVAISSVMWESQESRNAFYAEYGPPPKSTDMSTEPQPTKVSILLILLTILSTIVLAAHSTIYISIPFVLIGIATLALEMRPYFQRANR